MVMVYNELWTANQIDDLLSQLSGEKLERKYEGTEVLRERIADAEQKLNVEPGKFEHLLQLIETQYVLSWGIRRNDTPEYARYLGYVTSKELYPDFVWESNEAYAREVLDGKGKEVYGRS